MFKKWENSTTTMKYVDCGASPQVVLTSTYLLIKLLFVYFLKYFSLRQILVLWPPYIYCTFLYSLSTVHSPTTQTVISSPGSKLRRCPWSWWIGALLVYQEVNCWRIFKMKFSWRRRRSCTFQRKIIRSKNVAEYFCMQYSRNFQQNFEINFVQDAIL